MGRGGRSRLLVAAIQNGRNRHQAVVDKELLPYVTTRGDVFRAQVVGYFDGGGVSARAEVVIDATIPLPRILFWRDISHLGRGYALQTLGVDLMGPAAVTR